MAASFSFILSVIFVIINAVDGSIIDYQPNAAAAIGMLFCLQCRTTIRNSTADVEFYFKRSANSPDNLLFKKEIVMAAYRLKVNVLFNVSSGHYDLLIANFSPENAGTYTCLDRESSEIVEVTIVEPYASEEFYSLTPSFYTSGTNSSGLVPGLGSIPRWPFVALAISVIVVVAIVLLIKYCGKKETNDRLSAQGASDTSESLTQDSLASNLIATFGHNTETNPMQAVSRRESSDEQE